MRFLSLSSTRDLRAEVALRFGGPVEEPCEPDGAFCACRCGCLEDFCLFEPGEGRVRRDCIRDPYVNGWPGWLDVVKCKLLVVVEEARALPRLPNITIKSEIVSHRLCVDRGHTSLPCPRRRHPAPLTASDALLCSRSLRGTLRATSHPMHRGAPRGLESTRRRARQRRRSATWASMTPWNHH